MVSKLYSKQKLSTKSSDLVNKLEYHIDPNSPIMEFSIMKLFVINLVQLIKNKVSLAKNFNIAPSEIDRMCYWEYEYFLDEVNNNIKEENERNEKENEKYGNMNPNSMMRNAQRNMPKMPAGIPKLTSTPSIPHFN